MPPDSDAVAIVRRPRRRGLTADRALLGLCLVWACAAFVVRAGWRTRGDVVAGPQHRVASPPRREAAGPSPRAIATGPSPPAARGPFTTPVLTLSVVCACGLLLVAGAFALSRSGRPFADALYWIGLVVIVVPAAVWLTGRRPARSERLAVAAMVGVALYLAKVAYDPFQFAFSDDLVHAYNADEIIRTGALFHANPILPVTPRYPGLETVTAALASVTGLSTFVAGTVVIGAARLMLMLALFLLFETVSGSARVAGLGAVLYAANPNFVYFDAQFSYESLALPLLVVVLYGLARWVRAPVSKRPYVGVGLVCLVTVALVMTHHMSSYALAAFLLVVALIQLAVPRSRERTRWIAFTTFTIGCIVAWLVFVASDTVGYLDPVFTKAFNDTVRTISSEGSTRELFSSANGGPRQPASDRYLGLSAAAIVVMALPFGLRIVWSRYRKRPLALALAVAAAGYVCVLGLRLVPGAWEVGSRASEFLFVGTAFVLALAVLEWREGVRLVRRALPFGLPRLPPPVRRLAPGAAIAVAIAIVFAGGVVAGRPNDLRLAQPFAVEVHGATIRPPGSAVAAWARTELGAGHRVAADPSNGRLLLVYGLQAPVIGKHPDVRDVIRGTRLRPWQVRLLSEEAIPYVLVDRRRISDSASRGYFFCPAVCPRFPRSSDRKFDDQPGVSRLFTSGDVVVYDVRSLWGEGAGH